MRRLILFALLGSLIVAPMPASARTTKAKRITFETTTACAGACPHWTAPSNDEGLENACVKEPLTVPGSWDDHRIKVPTSIAGRKPYGLLFTLDPDLEYDGFICKVRNPGRSSERYELGATSANHVDENCDVVFFGCNEKIQFAVKPGETLVLRAYNWSDGPACAGTYAWVY